MWADLFLGTVCLIAGIAMLVYSGRAACTVADFADDDEAGNRPTMEWFALMAATTLALVFSGAFFAQVLP
jgi:hypothetical protein